MTKITKFQVTINPCIITDYILVIDEEEISYTVNDPTMVAFTYSFVQSN